MQKMDGRSSSNVARVDVSVSVAVSVSVDA